MSGRDGVERLSGEYYGNYRGNNGYGHYYYNADDNTAYSPDYDPRYPAWLQMIPDAIGRWIGRGVNAYNEASTQFERYWNSPANQMDQYAYGNVNPYEGFLSGSGGNGNPISSSNGDPLSRRITTFNTVIELE